MGEPGRFPTLVGMQVLHAMVSTVGRLKDSYPVYLPVDAEVVDVHAHAPDAGTTDEGGN